MDIESALKALREGFVAPDPQFANPKALAPAPAISGADIMSGPLASPFQRGYQGIDPKHYWGENLDQDWARMKASHGGGPLDLAMAVTGPAINKAMGIGPGIQKIMAKNMLRDSNIPITEETLPIAASGVREASRLRGKDFEWARQQRAREQNFTTDSYHGLRANTGWEEPHLDMGPNNGAWFFSTPNPDLASMYARVNPPGKTKPWPPSPHQLEGAKVLPLKLNTRDYHVYDAKGGTWDMHNMQAVKQAEALKKKGVVINNVHDEPQSPGGEVLPPQTVIITLDPTTVRSRFAKFDPTRMGENNILAGVGGLAALPPTAAAMLKALKGEE